MLIGHNPGLGELALALVSEGAALACLREKYPTGALATIDLPAEHWSAIERNRAVSAASSASSGSLSDDAQRGG